MTLRAKMVLSLVALSTAATLAIGSFSYRTTAEQMSDQIDRSLEVTAANLASPRTRRARGGLETARRELISDSDTMFQVLDRRGEPVAVAGSDLPVDVVDRAIAGADEPQQVTRDVVVDGQPARMLTIGGDRGADRRGALQVARLLTETEHLLGQLRSRIILASAAVMVATALLAWLFARQVTRRLVELTGAAEQVAATGDLEVAVPVSGDDETGRLGVAFNQMLAALARSKSDQRRLVQDAGHELRTPLTSLRTNIYTLSIGDALAKDQRDQLIADLRSETEELTRLIDEVVELATDRRDDEAWEWVFLGPLVDRVAGRAGARNGRDVVVHFDDTVVSGQPSALERAVGNMVENALKFDDRGPVEISCSRGRVEVTDRGPGFDAVDLPHVFDRFYRASSSRSRPGSGLGLAIVADVVERHGGTVYARNRPDGGAVVGFSLPTAGAALTESSPSPHAG